jgi:hypothetical protein
MVAYVDAAPMPFGMNIVDVIIMAIIDGYAGSTT